MAPPSTSKSHFPPPPAVPLDAPVGTKESFEKELQNLAAKAKEETRSKWIKEQSTVLLKSGTLLTLVAIYSNLSQLTLSPIYGGIPSSIYHSKGVMTACFLGWSTNLFLKRNLPVQPVTLLPLVAAYIPFIQFFAFKLSDFLGPVYGPPITEALTFFPLLLLSVGCTATVLDDLELTSGTGRLRAWTADAGPGIGSYAFFKTIEYFSSSYLNDVIGSTLVLSRVGLQLLLTSVFALFRPSKLLLCTLPALIHTVGFNTHFQAPWTTASLEASLNREGWSLIDRQDSNTGFISVVENQNDGFRAMRCDHSLLGGEWLRSPDGTKVREPIYGVFVMLEAIRLIDVPEPKVKDTEANALVIGLGIGTTPAALMAHGIWTTIVEIDPVVHDFATKYFGLRETHTKVIENAVTFASDVAGGFPHMGFQGRKFDYIVHDVFTGGAEPVELFTLEFLQDLKTMLTPDGVIAINYAGDFILPPARIIVKTIKSVFPTCRIFRESPKPSAAVLEEEKRDFTNMVIFCVNNPETKKVTFREPIEADLLGSNARRAFLKPKHEVPGSRFKEKEGDGGVLYRNGTERFKQWQQQSAVGHWKVMRGVLPAKIWENW